MVDCVPACVRRPFLVAWGVKGGEGVGGWGESTGPPSSYFHFEFLDSDVDEPSGEHQLL